MVILDEVKRRLSELAPEVTDLHDALAIERSRVRLEELEQKSASPEFYDDAAASGAVFAEMGELKDRLEQYAALQTMLEDAETLLEMCAEDDDPALAEEADAAVNSLDAKVEELRLVTLLNGEYDANNAILTFHAGAGGTEAQDWVCLLYTSRARMVLGAQQQSILRGQGFRLQHFVRRPAQQTERFPGQHHAMQRIHAAVFPKVHDKTPSDNLIKFILTKTAGREQ